MNLNIFEMRSLLEIAGFKIRGANRADCIHCEGRSCATVAFTSQVACCHRCKWAVNILGLARELGLLRRNHKAAIALREEAQERSKLDVEIRPFEAWREARIRQISAKFRLLSRSAIRADGVLARFSDCEQAWEVLAQFYHAEAQLSAAFDWLAFSKASVWLEEDSTPIEVFEAWRSHAA
jgi:hypothetical protein